VVDGEALDLDVVVDLWGVGVVCVFLVVGGRGGEGVGVVVVVHLFGG